MSTETFSAPVVARHGSHDPAAPLVVLLHGPGSTETEILGLAAHLPPGPQYAAVRAPIAEGGGYAWFANRGIGRPLADSLRATMDWFRTWLDAVAPSGRPVLLVGFSGGAAFAGGLVLEEPSGTPALRSSTAPSPSTPDSPPTPDGSPTCRCSWPTATTTTSSPGNCSTGPGATCSHGPAP